METLEHQRRGIGLVLISELEPQSTITVTVDMNWMVPVPDSARLLEPGQGTYLNVLKLSPVSNSTT